MATDDDDLADDDLAELDLESDWSVLRPSRTLRQSSGISSVEVRVGLERLTERTISALEQDVPNTRQPWMDQYRDSLQLFDSWAGHCGLQEGSLGTEPGALAERLEPLVRAFVPRRLNARGLAQWVCGCAWLREVGHVLWSALSDPPEFWPPNLWPGHIDLPHSTWVAADNVGTVDEAWIVELVARLSYQRGGLVPAGQIEHELEDPTHYLGELPALMAAAWLRQSGALDRLRGRIESRTDELRTSMGAADTSPRGGNCTHDLIDPEADTLIYDEDDDEVALFVTCRLCGIGGRAVLAAREIDWGGNT